jgi:hypothetical protein
MPLPRTLTFKAPGRFLMEGSPALEWGDFTAYVEVADDQFATRQVCVFRNGKVLRYDRAHWCDDFGMLTGLRFSRKPKWAVYYPGAELITLRDFEKVWRTAHTSNLWETQLASSRVAKWGPFRAS